MTSDEKFEMRLLEVLITTKGENLNLEQFNALTKDIKGKGETVSVLSKNG